MDQPRPLARLGFSGNRALTWPIWLIASVGPQLLLLLFGNYPNIIVGLIALTLAAGFSAPFLLWLGPLVLRHTRSWASRAGVVLVIYIVASVANSIAINFAVTGGLHISSVLSGAIFQTWFFLLISEVVNDRLEFIQVIHQLETVRAQLDQVIAWREKNLVSAKKTEIARIGAQLEAVRTRIIAALDTGESVQGLNNDVIGVLLKEMEQAAAVSSTPHAAPPIPNSRRRTLTQVLSRALSAQPGVAVPAAAFFATTWVVTGLSMSSWLVSIITPVLGGGILFGLLYLFTKLSQRITGRNAQAVTFLFILTQWLFSAVIAGIIPVLLSGIPLTALIAIGVQTTLIIFIIAVIVAYRDLGSEKSIALAQENNHLERQLIENSTALRLLRDRLRRFVHGDLQNVLVAVERKLSRQSGMKAEGEHSILDDMSRALDGLDEFISTESQAPSPLETITDLRSMWQGMLTIDFDMSEMAAYVVSQNNVTKTVISEILMEIVTNTAKHDIATSATISLDVEKADLLRLEMHSDGTSSTALAISGGHTARFSVRRYAGHGSRLLDEVCLSWTLTSRDGHTTLTATIPIISHNDTNAPVRTS